MRAEQVLEKTYDEIAYSPHFRMVLARAVWGLTPIEKLVLSFIAEAANADHGGASWYAQASISAELGCSRESVNRAFRELLARNLVSRHGGDMRIYRVSERLPPSKSCKVFLNLQELIRQSDPVIASDITEERKTQKATARKRKTTQHDCVSLTHLNDVPEPQSSTQAREEKDLQVEPADDLPDPEGAVYDKSPQMSLATPSKPVEPVTLVSSKQSIEQSHPWHSSDNPEQERARQLAELAARYPSE